MSLLAANRKRVISGEGGQQEFIIPGIYTWTVPADVTSVSVVCVGAGQDGGTSGGAGGSLGYTNDITVIPGNSYDVQVANVYSEHSYFIDVATVSGGWASYSGDSGGYGGLGKGFGGGGGAGGYSGNGGNGYTGDGSLDLPINGAGGGGAGGAYNSGGGGVGIYGEGTSGTASGGGGSGGTNGVGGSGGTYGGGGEGTPGTAGKGAVRIIWGDGRAFPSTNTEDI